MAPSAISQPTVEELTKTAVSKSLSTAAIHFSSPTSTSPPQLDASAIIVNRTTEPRAVPLLSSPEAASMTICTDHMVTAKWTEATGWQSPELRPYGPLAIMPTASVLHYATECFEGMKVYRGYDGKLRLFRPDRNCARMLMSSTRIALPPFPPEELEKLIKKLVAVDGPKWLPKSRPGTHLYLRPTHIATAAALGVQKPRESTLFILLCCFPSFDEPRFTMAAPQKPLTQPEEPAIEANAVLSPLTLPGLRLLASGDDMIRAWPGGFGYAKVGANYGPSLLAQAEACARGYSQILWLFGPEGYVTEAGASNFFVVWRTPGGANGGRLQLVTAPLDDKIILDGVTRRSVLELVRERLGGRTDTPGGLEALEVLERRFTMEEVRLAYEEGRLVEAFAAGTAFFIAPVWEIHFRGLDMHVPHAEKTMAVTASYAGVVKAWLRDIMYGREEHEWAVVVEEEEEEEEEEGEE